MTPPNVRFFAVFTLSLAFRYSVIFIVRLKKFQTMPPLFGLSSFLYLSFRDFGCGKAMSFDDLFRKSERNEMKKKNKSKKLKSPRFNSVEEYLASQDRTKERTINSSTTN